MGNSGILYSFEVGDPLLIAAMAYFHPLLLFSNELPLYQHTVHPSFVQVEDFWSENNLEQMTEVAIQLETKYGPWSKQGSSSTALLLSSKRKPLRAAARKTKGSESSGKKKSKKSSSSHESSLAILSLDLAIIKSIESCGVDLFPVTKKKNVRSVHVLLVGANGALKGLSTVLQQKLQTYFATKSSKSAEINVSVTTSNNEKDSETNVRFTSWKGGQNLTFLPSIKYVVFFLILTHTEKCGSQIQSTVFMG